jgi:putative transposase
VQDHCSGAATQPGLAQLVAGTVGVDLGVATLAALSTGEKVANPRHLVTAERRLKAAQRAVSRTEKTSARRARARARLARRHHEVAQRRSGALHALTKRLTTRWAAVAVEDLNVTGMTRSARGSLAAPGVNVRAKAGLNRAILDARFAEVRRQLDYKSRWYGSELLVVDRWAPTSKTCSSCGWRNPSLSLRERVFHCQSCGLEIDRDVNAAVNIEAAATDPAAWPADVASGSGETLNARRGGVRPSVSEWHRQRPAKREDTTVSPRWSDPPALQPMV